MARNKYPEETISRILEVSLNLFLEKGYENTSIQDIVDNLGGLSKGAIYHHFKSKEDILTAVMDKAYQVQDSGWAEIVSMQGGLTGRDKLKLAVETSLNDPGQNEMFSIAPDFMKNPQMLALLIQSIFEESAPLILQPIIEQGVADGSIKTDYPRELAEVLLILMNIWLTPMVHHDTPEALKSRLGFFIDLFSKLDLDIFDDDIQKRFEELVQLFDEKKHSQK